MNPGTEALKYTWLCGLILNSWDSRQDMFRIAICFFAMTTAIILLLPSAVRAQQPVQRKGFLIFDSLLYQGKPDLSKYGIHPLRGMNPPQGSSNEASAPLDEAKAHDSMRSLNGYTGIVYLDFEMWPLTDASPELIHQSVARYIRVAEIAHDAAPSASFGSYGIIPCREYWGLVNHDVKKLAKWQECNRAGKPIADHVAVLFPSLYTFYNNQHGWDVYAKGMLDEARRYKKPVYAFLWPEFHPSNSGLKGTNVPAKFWRHQLEFCSSRADGIVLWGGWQERWQDDAAWWIETKNFIASLDGR
jgi:hypothetical protein